MKDRLKAALQRISPNNVGPGDVITGPFDKGACTMKLTETGSWCCSDRYKREICEYYVPEHRGGWTYHGNNTKCKDVAPNLPKCKKKK